MIFFLKNILEKDAGQFFSTNDFLYLIDIIYREIDILKDNCVSEKLLIEYCKTLIVMINSPLWEEYEGKITIMFNSILAFKLSKKIKILMKEIISSKELSDDIKECSKEVFDELISFS